ncbi:MAG: cytochrome P450 [Rhizobiaceae bacterium]|nr:cytochrome P450 [Rhizobiaceae bacterium]
MSIVFSDRLSSNPFEAITDLRSQGRLVRQKIPIIGKVWFTTDQEMATLVLKDSSNFGVRKPNGKAVGLQWWMPKTISLLASNMLAMDGDEHKRLRQIVDRAFRREAIMALEPEIEIMANDMVSELFKERQEVDLLATFARRFPLAVICELLGLPKKDRQQFAIWAEGFTRVTGVLDFLKLIPRLKAMTKYIRRKAKEARLSGGKGLIAELVIAQDENDQMSDDELIAMVFLLLIAGHETTTHLISGGVLALLQHEDQKHWLMEDWGRTNTAIEELLRYVTPVQMSKPRYAFSDQGMGGVHVKRGELVMALLTAANYDEALIDNPQMLNLDRRPNRHIAFGSGIHFCLGHQLARLEGKHAIKALFSQHPNLALATDQIKFRKRIGINALTELKIKPN